MCRDRAFFRVTIQEEWGRPTGLLQSLWGSAVRILLASADSSILIRCPNRTVTVCGQVNNIGIYNQQLVFLLPSCTCAVVLRPHTHNESAVSRRTNSDHLTVPTTVWCLHNCLVSLTQRRHHTLHVRRPPDTPQIIISQTLAWGLSILPPSVARSTQLTGGFREQRTGCSRPPSHRLSRRTNRMYVCCI